MTASGTRQAGGPRCWRVLTAVLALYALVLQIVLAGAAAPLTASLFDTHCSAMTDGAQGTEPTLPGDPAHYLSDCCTLCHPPAAVAPLLPAAAAIVWPVHRATPAAWRSNGTASARAPPPSEARPRAPPIA